MISLKQNHRGFLLGEFEDRYGRKCVVQEASVQSEQGLWLGVDLDEEGNAVVGGRFLLTRDLARELLPMLRYFARNGSLGYDDPKERFQVGTWVSGIGETNRGIEGRVVEIVPNVHMVVQNNLVNGQDGQVITLWKMVDLVWEPMEAPENIPSRYDILRENGLV